MKAVYIILVYVSRLLERYSWFWIVTFFPLLYFLSCKSCYHGVFRNWREATIYTLSPSPSSSLPPPPPPSSFLPLPFSPPPRTPTLLLAIARQLTLTHLPPCPILNLISLWFLKPDLDLLSLSRSYSSFVANSWSYLLCWRSHVYILELDTPLYLLQMC